MCDCNTQPNTWNFDSCLGCEDCSCSAASQGPSCDIKTGQCQCVPTVTGRTCDRCIAGFWDYTDQGCKRKFLLFELSVVTLSNIPRPRSQAKCFVSIVLHCTHHIVMYSIVYWLLYC